MPDHHRKTSEDQIHFFPRDELTVEPIDGHGFILDIGGGGEGIIGKLHGNRVIAIDASRPELEEAAPGPVKIVMNAAELGFLDASFDTATAFYSLMYISEPETRRKVFAEVYRVLTPGGRFLVWDGVLPPRDHKNKEVAAFLLSIELGEEIVETGYGMKWPDEGRGSSSYLEMAEDSGFQIERQEEEGRKLFIELRKPGAG